MPSLAPPREAMQGTDALSPTEEPAEGAAPQGVGGAPSSHHESDSDLDMPVPTPSHSPERSVRAAMAATLEAQPLTMEAMFGDEVKDEADVPDQNSERDVDADDENAAINLQALQQSAWYFAERERAERERHTEEQCRAGMGWCTAPPRTDRDDFPRFLTLALANAGLLWWKNQQMASPDHTPVIQVFLRHNGTVAFVPTTLDALRRASNAFLHTPMSRRHRQMIETQRLYDLLSRCTARGGDSSTVARGPPDRRRQLGGGTPAARDPTTQEDVRVMTREWRNMMEFVDRDPRALIIVCSNPLDPRMPQRIVRHTLVFRERHMPLSPHHEALRQFAALRLTACAECGVALSAKEIYGMPGACDMCGTQATLCCNPGCRRAHVSTCHPVLSVHVLSFDRCAAAASVLGAATAFHMVTGVMAARCAEGEEEGGEGRRRLLAQQAVRARREYRNILHASGCPIRSFMCVGTLFTSNFVSRVMDTADWTPSPIMLRRVVHDVIWFTVLPSSTGLEVAQAVRTEIRRRFWDPVEIAEEDKKVFVHIGGRSGLIHVGIHVTGEHARRDMLTEGEAREALRGVQEELVAAEKECRAATPNTSGAAAAAARMHLVTIAFNAARRDVRDAMRNDAYILAWRAGEAGVERGSTPPSP